MVKWSGFAGPPKGSELGSDDGQNVLVQDSLAARRVTSEHTLPAATTTDDTLEVGRRKLRLGRVHLDVLTDVTVVQIGALS